MRKGDEPETKACLLAAWVSGSQDLEVEDAEDVPQV